MEKWFNAPQKLFSGRRQRVPVRFWSHRRRDISVVMRVRG
jgi:hypothetical protein